MIPSKDTAIAQVVGIVALIALVINSAFNYADGGFADDGNFFGDSYIDDIIIAAALIGAILWPKKWTVYV